MKTKLLLQITVLLAVTAFTLSAQCKAGEYSYSTIKKNFCPSAPPEVPIADNSEISLKKALSIVMENNPDSKAALAKIRYNRAELSKATALFLPKLDFYTGYARGDSPSSYLFKTIDQRQFKPGTDFNDPGIYENIETGVRANYTLYNGRRNSLAKNMVRESVNMSLHHAESVINQVTAELITIWYDMLSAEEYLSITEESVETVRTQLELMEVRFRGGSALKSDILSLKVRLAQSEEEVLKSKNRQKLTLHAMKNIIGLSPSKKITALKNSSYSFNIPDSYDEAVKIAMFHRPELRQARSAVRKAKMGSDMAENSSLPTVDLSGRYYHDDPSMEYKKDNENWVVAVELNWNIFSGFSHVAGRRQAHALLQETLANDRKTILGVQLDVKTAYLMLEEATARLEVATKSVEMAEETFILVKKQYEGGSATVTRYLESELAKNSAKIRAVTARFDREKAKADIARSIGLLMEPEKTFSKKPNA